MSKVIILKNCKECPKSNYGYKHFLCTQTGKDAVFDYIPDWCPLLDLPKKDYKNRLAGVSKGVALENAGIYIAGWNDCIDAITGEVEV